MNAVFIVFERKRNDHVMRPRYIKPALITAIPKIHQNAKHDDVIKWKHFPRNWPFVRGIHRRPVNSPYKGQWRRALMFSLICVWVNDWVNNRKAGDLRRYRAHCDVTVMNKLNTLIYSLLNILRPRQSGRHFPYDIFKCIFLKENVLLSIKISLNFVPNGPINNIPTLVLIMSLS